MLLKSKLAPPLMIGGLAEMSTGISKAGGAGWNSDPIPPGERGRGLYLGGCGSHGNGRVGRSSIFSRSSWGRSYPFSATAPPRGQPALDGWSAGRPPLSLRGAELGLTISSIGT